MVTLERPGTRIERQGNAYRGAADRRGGDGRSGPRHHRQCRNGAAVRPCDIRSARRSAYREEDVRRAFFVLAVLVGAACGESATNEPSDATGGESGRSGSSSGGSAPSAGEAGENPGGQAVGGSAGRATGGRSGSVSTGGSVSGSGGEADPGGMGGDGGEACVPRSKGEACGFRTCGLASDGCGAWVECGPCPSAAYACDQPTGECRPLPECQCNGNLCGRLACPEPIFCGTEPDCGGSVLDPCVTSGPRTECNSASVCQAHIPGQHETCCASKSAECSIGYTTCPNLWAVSFVTGQPCGTCMTNGALHHCGPGWTP